MYSTISKCVHCEHQSSEGREADRNQRRRKHIAAQSIPRTYQIWEEQKSHIRNIFFKLALTFLD